MSLHLLIVVVPPGNHGNVSRSSSATRSFPLNAEQRSMLFFEHLLGPGVAHNITCQMPLPDGCSIADVEAAVGSLVSRQEALRVALTGDSTGFQQLGSPDVRLGVHEADGPLPHWVFNRIDHLHNAHLFPRDRPVRAHFEVVTERGVPRTLLAAVDHLVADGYSTVLLKDEMFSRLTREDPGELPMGFADYCRERAAQYPAAQQAETEQWSGQFDGIEPLTGLMPHAGGPLTRTQIDTTTFNGDVYQALRKLSAQLKATPFVTIATLCALAVWRRTRRRGFAFYTPVDSRRDETACRSIGYFINERPVICRVDPDQPLAALARATSIAMNIGIRTVRASVPDLAAAIPAYGAGLMGDIDYIQLHLALRDDTSAHPFAADEPAHATTVLGAFQPAYDLTCTTFRFDLTPSYSFIRVFFGGSHGHHGVAADICADAVALLRGAAGHTDLAAGALVDTLLDGRTPANQRT
jgi:hypothetical protein